MARRVGTPIRLVATLLALAWLPTCRQAEGAVIGHVPEPEIPDLPVASPPSVAPAPVPPPTPPPPPRPSAEELARQRQEAERQAFEARYPMHGVAFHFLTQVFAEPDSRSPVVGYLRRGTQVRLTEKQRGRGCSRGWHELPGRGYVCSGRGMQIGRTVQTFSPSPIAASLADDLPYAYTRVEPENAVLFSRLPTLQEEEEGNRVLARLVAADEAREREAAVAAVAARARAVAGSNASPEEGEPDPADGEVATAGVTAPAPPGSQEDVGGNAHDDSEGQTLPPFMRGRLRKGYYVSIDRVEDNDVGRRFFRSVRGGFIRQSVTRQADPPTFRGVVLGEQWQLPLGFVIQGGVRALRPAGPDPRQDVSTAGAIGSDDERPVADRYVAGDRLRRGAAFPFAGEHRYRGTRYFRTRDGTLIPSARSVIIRPVERPAEVQPGEKWIHVDLSQQVLVAYEGDKAVFATLVSTGRDGFETPTGIFRIMSKHVSTTMDDEEASDGPYSIEDVPWTMYFSGNFALHGAFWHSSFGRVRSHGCVNLAPSDARWLFQWSGPNVPPGWHGAFARRGNPGTRVVIVR